MTQAIRSSGFTPYHFMVCIMQLKSKWTKFLQSGAGFTLIELLVVMSVMAILGVGGIAAFVSYNQRQQVITVAQDVVTMLNQAKNRAQSQVKPSTPHCNDSFPLQGYKVTINSVSKTYVMSVQCGGSADSITSKKISYSNVNFGSSHTFGFPIFYGGIIGADQTVGTPITVSWPSVMTKTITVYGDGRILLQ